MTDAVAAAPACVRVGAYALITDERDRLLLVRGASRSDGPGSWWMPGGGLEFGEDPEVGVVRELQEETGLSGRVVGLVGSISAVHPTSVDRPGEPVHIVGFVYRVEVVGGELRDEVDGSSDRCAWFTRDELADLALSPTGRRAVELAWPDP